MMKLPGGVRRKMRRGIAVAALIITLALVNLVVLGILSTGANESETALSRLEGARALYACESGARVVIRSIQDGGSLPVAGTSLSLGTASVRYVSAPATGAAGDVIVEGSSGNAVRRTVITVDYGP
jgi:hypothetical protein